MKQKVLLFGIIIVLGLIFLLTNPILVKGQSNLLQTRPSPTPNVKSTTTLPASVLNNETITSNKPQLTDIEVINLYKEAVEVAQNTVNSVHSTANLVLTVVGVVFTALGLAVAIGTWSIGNTITKSADQLEKARDQLQTAQNRFEGKTEEFEKKLNDAVLRSFGELAQKQNDVRLQITSAEKMLSSLQTELAQLKSSGERDRQFIKKPLTLLQIDEYIMQALSSNTSEKANAILALIEISNRSDAVVRRRAIEALGALDVYDEKVARRLAEIIKFDPAQGVRKEAEKSLKLIEAKKPKKNTRQKS